MTHDHAPELFWLASTALFTAVLWIPYVLQLIVQIGFGPAIWDPTEKRPMKRAGRSAPSGRTPTPWRTLRCLRLWRWLWCSWAGHAAHRSGRRGLLLCGRHMG